MFVALLLTIACSAPDTADIQTRAQADTGVVTDTGVEVDPLTVDDDGDGFTEDQGDCNDDDSQVVPLVSECLPFDESATPTSGADCDCDGLPDESDGRPDDGPCADPDGDCLTNADEVDCGTDMQDGDSDRDGTGDADEC